MKNSNLKRFMASLLAVVMIFSVVGVSPPFSQTTL